MKSSIVGARMPRTIGSTYLYLFVIFFSILTYAQPLLSDQSDASQHGSEQTTQIDDETEQTIAHDDQENEDEPEIITQRFIKDIIVKGNRTVPTEAILYRIPHRIGQPFMADGTRQLITNVYTLGDLPFGLSYFKNIKVAAEHVGTDGINLIVIVEEKELLETMRFEGNKHLSESDIKKKIPFEDIPVIDEQDLGKYIAVIKKLYTEKGYHFVEVQAHLERTDGLATAVFTVSEQQKSYIKRVYFKGNDYFSSKKLRSIVFTREDWPLSFMDRAGMYQAEMVEADQFVIENFYQSHGFLHASVVDVDVDFDECSKQIYVTFIIEEGEQYTVSCVSAPGNDICDEETLLRRIKIKPGDLYSKDRIRETMEGLRLLWGEHGYIYADIAPSIQPNDDEKTVDIAFYSELGNQVHLNRINIIGNSKTRDWVIRRKLLLKEGELLTTQKLEESKTRVEHLGYFDQRDGVNWKINRVGKNLADLDLLVKEVKTGQVHGKIGFGGSPVDITNPNAKFTIGAGITDTNLFGLGIQIDFSTELSRDHRLFNLNVTEPYLFDKPIYLSVDTYIKQSNYEDLDLTEKEVAESLKGGTITSGFYAKRLQDTLFSFELGVQDVTYNGPTIAKNILGPIERREFQEILNVRFLEGTFGWLGMHAAQDLRNHPMHPSRGYQWAFYSKLGIPTTAKKFPPELFDEMGMPLEQREKIAHKLGYWKIDGDVSWYTPLIGENDLVLCLHAHAGMVSAFKNNTIPYRELYHIGGPASVRGFLFGEIGPTWRSNTDIARGIQTGESLGGSKAFWVNAELIFPVSGDFSMKGGIFYDGGAGWDTPDADGISKARLKRNNFGYRHSVGFGIRMLQPTPVKLDWGFKLDRKKGEPASQTHLTMYHNF